jgi:hypothetical protein
MTPDDRDPIEALLRAHARAGVPDDGFSARVMRALPPGPRPRAWLRPALVAGSGAVGALLAWLLAPAGTSIVQGFVDLSRAQGLTPSAWAALGLAMGMAAVAAVLVADEA